MAEESPVVKFRESHHRIAQMFAMGMTASAIRRQTGMSMRRLTIIWNSPAFQDLVKGYSAKTEEKLEVAQDAFVDLAISNMMRAETMLADRIDQAEETGELLPVPVLNKIVEGRADRFGYGKNSTIRHEHDFASALDRAIARSAGVKIVEGETAPPPGVPTQVTAALPSAEPQQQSSPVEVAPQPKRSFVQVLGAIKRRKVA